MAVLWLELRYTMKYLLYPWEIPRAALLDFPWSQVIFDCIAILSSQYKKDRLTLFRRSSPQTFHDKIKVAFHFFCNLTCLVGRKELIQGRFFRFADIKKESVLDNIKHMFISFFFRHIGVWADDSQMWTDRYLRGGDWQVIMTFCLLSLWLAYCDHYTTQDFCKSCGDLQDFTFFCLTKYYKF